MTTATAIRTTPKVPFHTAKTLYSFVDAGDWDVRQCERNHGSHKYVYILVVHEDSMEEPVRFCARCGVRQCYVPVIEDDPTSMCLLAIGHAQEHHHRDHRNRWRAVAALTS